MLKGIHAHQLYVVYQYQLCILHDNIEMDPRELIVSQNGDSWCVFFRLGVLSAVCLKSEL